MDRCVYCQRPDQRGEQLGQDFWCHGCIVEGRFAAFVEAQALVSAIVAERARRAHDLPKQRRAEKQVT